MQHVVKFSGGKDSLATLLSVRATQPQFHVVFCDTGWEHPDTYRYLDYVEEKIGQQIHRVKNPKYAGGLPEQAFLKKRFPSMQARFCTEELKVHPGIDFVLTLNDDVTVYQGVRADESEARRNLKRNDDYFRFYFEPWTYRSDYATPIKKVIREIGKLKPQAAQDLFSGQNVFQELQDELRRLTHLHETTKRGRFYTYRKKDVLEFCDKFSADVVRPVLKWTAAETIDYCLAQGFKLNPLYYRGARRVGCYPCIYSNLNEIHQIAQNDPWRIDQIDYLEDEMKDFGGTFFASDKIPERFKTGLFQRDGKLVSTATIRDVVAYAARQAANGKLLADEGRAGGCISVYNICES